MGRKKKAETGENVVKILPEETAKAVEDKKADQTDGEFVLTDENYYSQEANERYMSFHNYMAFVSSNKVYGCEAKAMAMLRGEYEEPITDAILTGAYVDRYFEGTLDSFKTEHPEIFTQKGELRADYKLAEKMIARCERDEKFMQYLSGEKQTIMTANMFGCDWKIKMDSYIPDVAIVDLKTTASMHKMFFVPDIGWVNFVDAYNYPTQLAIYQRVVYINTGKELPCYIAAVSKDKEPDIEILYIDQTTLDDALAKVEMNMPHILAVKNGEVEPIRCGMPDCLYCRKTKVLTGPIHYTDLIGGERG